jgi:hypothetical protein
LRDIGGEKSAFFGAVGGILINLKLSFDDESQSGFCSGYVFRTITEKMPWRIVKIRNESQGRR